VKIVNLVAITNRFVSEFVSLSDAGTAFNSGSGHPDCEAEGVVIATVATLSEGGPTELSSPNHEGRIEKPLTFQIRDETGNGLIDGLAVFAMTVFQLLLGNCFFNPSEVMQLLGRGWRGFSKT